jgi:hypothetical protein
MRAATLLFGVGLAFAIALPATGQQFGTLFNGVNPRNINLVPIDTNKALKSMNVSTAFRTPSQQKAFSLTNVFPKISMPSWPPKIATPSILSQKNNPFQPNPVLGKNPFVQK